MTVREELLQEIEHTKQALADVADADFEKQVHYPDWDPLLSGDVTLKQLFHYVKAHFDSHAEQLRQIVARATLPDAPPR